VSTFPVDFDPLAIPDPPQSEPREIRAGDTLQWARPCDDYPPAEGFNLSYAFVSRTATYQIAGAMVKAGSQNYEVTIPAATTAAWAPGRYRWQAYITDNAQPPNRFTVAEGIAEVLPNLQAQTGGFDDRDPDEITLDVIKAALQGKASNDVQEYRVFEKEIKHYTWAELLKVCSIYEERVRSLRIRRGEKLPKRTVGVSFGFNY
jgi:hypothetical protein